MMNVNVNKIGLWALVILNLFLLIGEGHILSVIAVIVLLIAIRVEEQKERNNNECK